MLDHSVENKYVFLVTSYTEFGTFSGSSTSLGITPILKGVDPYEIIQRDNDEQQLRPIRPSSVVWFVGVFKTLEEARECCAAEYNKQTPKRRRRKAI
jgi:hypothetical protein